MPRVRYTLMMLLVVFLISTPASLAVDELVLGTSLLLGESSGLVTSRTNPARMLNEKNTEFAFQLPASVGLNAWNAKTLSLLGETWTDTQRDQVGAGVNSNGLQVALDVNPFLAYRYGNYAGRVGARAVGQATVPKSITDVAFYGIDLVGSSFDEDVSLTYDLSQVDAWTAGYVEAVASAAMDVPQAAETLGVNKVTVGANVKYLFGLAYVTSDVMGELAMNVIGADTDITLSEFQAGYLESRNGHGFAVDLGVVVQVNSEWMVDASVSNFGSMRWSGVEGEYQVMPEGSDGTVLDFRFDRDNFAFDVGPDDDFELETVPYDGGDVTLKLPLELRLGGTYTFNEQVTFAAQLTHTRTNRPQRTLTQSSVTVGTEYRPLPYLPLRASLHAGTATTLQLNLGFGVHYGPVTFDAALQNAAGLLFDAGQGMGFGMQLGVTF